MNCAPELIHLTLHAIGEQGAAGHQSNKLTASWPEAQAK
jgi:hypothetical protein